MRIKIAVLQYNIPFSPGESQKKLNEMVASASMVGAKLVVAPETSVGEVGYLKETGEDFFPVISEIAKKHSVYLATSYYKKEKDDYYNQGCIVSPEGKLILSHKKIYPAPPEIKNIGIKEGKAVNVVDTPIGRLGMLICKDGFNKYSHFLYEELNKKGVDIICIPAWSLKWKDINTQEYIKGLYTYGAFISRSFILMSGNLNPETGSFGRSLIISPILGVIKEASVERREIIVEEINLAEVKQSRLFDEKWQPNKRIFIK